MATKRELKEKKEEERIKDESILLIALTLITIFFALAYVLAGC